MTDHTTRRYDDGEVFTGIERQRRWTPEEKVRIVAETYLPGVSVSFVARGWPVTAVASAVGVSRPHLSAMRNRSSPKRRGAAPRWPHRGRRAQHAVVLGRARDRLRQRREEPAPAKAGVRVAFALDRCDHDAMGHEATTGGITAEDVQDLTVATMEHRHGRKRRRVEYFFNKLKRFRRIALRCEKTLCTFMGFVQLACAMIWLR